MTLPPFAVVLEKDSVRLNAMLANLQVMANHRTRRDLARMLSHLSNQVMARRFPDAAPETGRTLAQEGYLALGQVLSEGQIKDIQEHFRTRRVHAAHVFSGGDPKGVDFATAAATQSHAGYALPDVIDAPHLLELANSDRILAAAEAYLGCPPTLYSMNAFWSFPGDHPLRPDLQKFHRDRDDFRFCTFFVLLTDAAVDNGAHRYLRFSHDPDVLKSHVTAKDRALAASLDFDGLFAPRSDLDELCTDALGDFLASFHGPAGTAVIEDTYGLHRGDKPRQPRLLFWARYGLFGNKTYHADGRALGGVEPGRYRGRVNLQDEYYLFVNRLLLKPSAAS